MENTLEIVHLQEQSSGSPCIRAMLHKLQTINLYRFSMLATGWAGYVQLLKKLCITPMKNGSK